MKAFRIVMPSTGDMKLLSQDKERGTITLQPIYFGGECAGPILQTVEVEDGKDDVVVDSYRIKVRKDADPKLVKAD